MTVFCRNRDFLGVSSFSGEKIQAVAGSHFLLFCWLVVIRAFAEVSKLEDPIRLQMHILPKFLGY